MHVEHAKKTRFELPLKELWANKFNILRGGILGTIIGALPGAGADIAAWIAYAISKKFSKNPQAYGKGNIDGVIGASSANNAALSGTYVPTLVFGIPGDSLTAIVVGVLMLKGIQPGPLVFTSSSELVNQVYVAFFISTLLIIPLGFLAMAISGKLFRVKSQILFPIILLLSILGTYATNNSWFDVGSMLIIGIVVWLMNANNYPIAPMVLAFVLGKIIEQNFMNSYAIANGNLLVFFSRPIAGIIGVLAICVWCVPPLWRVLKIFIRKQPSAKQ